MDLSLESSEEELNQLLELAQEGNLLDFEGREDSHGSLSFKTEQERKVKLENNEKEANQALGKRKTDPRNAERCRRHREKRKQVREKIWEDNLKFKHEKKDFLAKISELEFEVQTLRGQNVVDLEKENELLRAEVEKHKQYVKAIVEVTRSCPLPTTEDTLKLLRSGLESSVGQVVGLLYSSMVDKTWKICEDRRTEDGIGVKCWYQLLPSSCTIKNAQRWKKIYSVIEKECFDVEYLSDLSHSDSNSIYENMYVEQVFPRTQISPTEEVFCGRLYAPKDSPTHELVYACASKDVDLFSSAYPYMKRAAQEKTNVPSKILVSATTSISSLGNDEYHGIRRLRGNAFESYVFRKTESAKCTYSYIMTFPLDEDYLAMFNPQGDPIIHEDGSPGKLITENLSNDWKALRKQIKGED